MDLCVSPMRMLTTAIVGFAYLEILGETKISIGWKGQGTKFCSEGKVPRIKRSMNNVPCSISTTELRTMRNRIRELDT